MDVPSTLGDWYEADGPLYARLAESMRRAVADGRLQPGTIVPAERKLADRLAIGRSTVIRAYDLLRDEGVLQSRRGSGTWVAGAEPGEGTVRHDGLQRVAPNIDEDVIDLATASLPAPAELAAALRSLGEGPMRRVLLRPGYSHAGVAELREAIAEQFSAEGLPTGPREVLVTTGAQQAIDLIVRHFTSGGDDVVMEDPSSAGALDLLREAGCVVHTGRSVASSGAAPIIEVIRRRAPQLVYLQVPFGPEGAMVRAGDMVTLAGRLPAEPIVVEESSLRDLTLGEAPPPYLAAKASGDRVLTVGSMSKVYWGGIRVGWIRGAEKLIERLARTKARADLGTPVLSQHLAVRMLRRRRTVLAARLEQIRASRDALAQELAEHLPEFEWTLSDGGLTIWVRMPRGTSEPFAEVAHRYGVLVATGESLSPSGQHSDCLRLSYAPPPEVLREGVARLAAAWNEFDDRTGLDRTKGIIA
ncbi:aminotransferase-like domain-containing protein [Glycomyces xiaoerkulensis]|uniref:aminotransferase-like domain-containing protein n=1 Tax=Glycomyces xiaoerkulensis TaxID=2038139 RepID=UPI0018E43BBA|nr:PLP-dependent aminotransferase family protein [Glycomyces xiaoerkulensis]